MSRFKLPKYYMHWYVVLSNIFYLFRVGSLKEQMVINLSAVLLLKVHLYSVLFILLYHYTIMEFMHGIIFTMPVFLIVDYQLVAFVSGTVKAFLHVTSQFRSRLNSFLLYFGFN